MRLGTYTGKVPIYNALKAAKGTMFFLPLPLENTLERSDEAGDRYDFYIDELVGLPDPKLYIIIDGCPTKDKIVWQGLVDVPRVKQAAQKLQETNWLYASVDATCVDEAAKKTVEKLSTMPAVLIWKKLQKMWQVYKPTQFDPWIKICQQTKISNTTSFVPFMNFPWTIICTSLMCSVFPLCSQLENLVNFIQYVKSRLFNKDSTYRKYSEFVFYYL